MVRVYSASLLALALVTPAVAQVCHPAHHKVTHSRKVAHHESGLGVVIDQARLISFPKPVKTVYVGNPVIADITMLDPQHAFILGKTFGLTNMIALDGNGAQVSNQQVVVYNNGAAVTVNRGGEQYDYMCTAGHCETAPRPGDPAAFASTTESTALQHEGNASGAGTGAPAGPSPTSSTSGQ